MSYVLVQEGGSSNELYVHAHATLIEAEDGRKSCAEAAYRTSHALEVPPELAALGEVFYSFLDEFVHLPRQLSYPED